LSRRSRRIWEGGRGDHGLGRRAFLAGGSLSGWSWQHPEVEHVISHRNAGATRRLLETVAATGAERS
jgi:hypothetical protein